jgi:hypothetical protein
MSDVEEVAEPHQDHLIGEGSEPSQSPKGDGESALGAEHEGNDDSAEVLERTESADEPATAATDGALSAGEGGTAGGDEVVHHGLDKAEIIIGEIPDIHDLSVMRWTARCTFPSHDLLGYYADRGKAEEAGSEHLSQLHS